MSYSPRTFQILDTEIVSRKKDQNYLRAEKVKKHDEKKVNVNVLKWNYQL